MRRICLVSVTWLFSSGMSSGSDGGLRIPENPRWKPVVDEVYLQEVGSRIETENPLLAVAVFDNTVYVGNDRGVYRVGDGALESAGGPPSEIRRLRVLKDALWAAGPKGLWRYADGEWCRIAPGAFVDVCLHQGDVIVASTSRVFRLEDGQLVVLDRSGSPALLLGIASYSETIYVRHAGRVGFLDNGRYEYGDVSDWGHLPRASNTRDMLAFGPRLLDCTNCRFTNSHRHDLHVPKGYINYVTDTKAMGPREQGIRRWDRDPLELDGGGGRGILDPSSYLDAYWMGRYYEFITAPVTKDPNLLTVERRDVQRGAAPYDHTPRPHVF